MTTQTRAPKRTARKRTLSWSQLLREGRRIDKLTRLVAQWREQATWLCGTERYDTIATLRRCADQLARILKP